MPPALKPAMPLVPSRLGMVGARHDGLLRKLATCVTVLAAAPIGEGASSAWAQGGIAAAMAPGDSVEKHVADTIAAGAGIVDEKIARLMAGDAADRVHDLLGYGVPFDRDRIRAGLEKACEKRDVSAETIDQLVSDIENDVYQNMEREVASEYIGELVMKKLRQLDPVAYVRFASVYREFKDASDFVEEVEPLLGKPSDSV